MRERLEYVDIAKGFGILLVVCSHSDALDLMWLMMGMFVPIFYFCSGYTYSNKDTLKDAMMKRARRLLVPYIFFNVVLFVAFWHFSVREFFGMIYSRYCLYPLDVTPNIKFLTSGNYPLWFLTSMTITYFLFYLTVYLERFKYVLLSLYAVVSVGLTFSPILLPWSIDTAPLTAIVMYAGMECRRRDLLSISIIPVIYLLLIYIGLQYVGGDMNLSVRMYGTSIVIYFILAIFGSFIVLWGCKYLQGSFIGRCLLTMGKHSMTIFCIEIVFIILAKDIWHWLFPSAVLGYVAGMFEIFLALLGGWTVSVLLHQNSFLRRIAYGA